MWHPSSAQWWMLLVVALLIVVLWPPSDDRSLGVKFVNWVVDPRDQLPTLPGPLAFGQGDDPDAVNAHDLQTRMYDELYAKGGWTRRRLELKVAGEPVQRCHRTTLLVGLEC